MRAGLRFGSILLVGGLWLAPVLALAQETAPPATTNTPATDAIGPRELQNFSLPGTTTKPAEQPTQAPVATAPAARTTERATNEAAATSAAAPKQVVARSMGASTPPEASTRAPVPQAAVAPPLPDQPPSTIATPPALTTAAIPQPIEQAGAIAPDNKLPILPWIFAALALAGGAIFFLWRRHARAALAGGVEFDLFAAPEPAPQPRRPSAAPRASPAPEPQPVPRPAPAPKPAPPVSHGIVASRLRPALEIGIQPLRCVVQDDQVTIEFEVDLYNAGTAPARAVLAEASLFNAGANQEQELAAFFANPVGAGSGIDAIPPLKRLTLTSQVVAPRAAIQEYELAGRKSFVPVIAFNARYEWGGGKGQTSAAFLVGRETGGEKVGPLRLDLGPRDVRGLAARSLPTAIRT